MRKFALMLFSITVLLLSTACSKDDANEPSVVGTWQLTTWTINVPIDLNNDTITSTNLLDEAICANNETLVFESNGTYSSNVTYNPMVNISLLTGMTDEYVFDVECDLEGTSGLAGSYIQNGNSVTLLNNIANIDGNRLSIVFEDAIDIYNEDFTEIVVTKDLTLIYTKK